MSTELILRIATIDDLDCVEKIFINAIKVMDSNGINQWDNIYPNKEILKEDILKGEMFLGIVNCNIHIIK